ncbi:MAG: flagellar M-ring protein FliF, partial [candidate division NC10 bacterium]|nr:flagellar M-ring protein FliF [candidate division NC10 bacterium]
MIAGALHQTKVLWAGFNRPQQVVFAVLGLVSFLAIFGLVYWTNRPDFITLYAQLDPSDAAAIVDHLKEANVPYQLSGNGTRVLVPSSVVHDTRLSLA